MANVVVSLTSGNSTVTKGARRHSSQPLRSSAVEPTRTLSPSFRASGPSATVKACPAGAVTYEDNLVKIDHKACIAYGPSCEEACVAKCPRQIFRLYPGRKVISRAKVDGLKMAG